MPACSYINAHPDGILTRKPGVKLDRIVIHTIEGSYKGCIAWFQQGKPPRPVATAAHYIISRNGDVCQMVPDAAKCYHAGGYNSRSIGIEHEARIAPWPVRLDAAGAVKPPPFPTNDFPDAMLITSARVVAALCWDYAIPADREHIVGHSEVPGATHSDPGAAFPWAAYMANVSAGLARLNGYPP